MTKMIKAACVQMNSGPDIQENLKAVEGFVREAAAQGATLIATPEVTDQVISNRSQKLDQAMTESEHPGVPFFAGLAKELSIWLLIGSMCIKVDQGKIANRSFLFAPDGGIRARYDKIHLYDADLPCGESWRESKIFISGRQAVATDMGNASLGMSICYDVRFPYLYRDLAKRGAQILSVPAAFTVTSGKAHWEVLLRARAIETGSFVIAPGQCGDHGGARKTYGHSMIIGPWGEILAALTDGEAVVNADLNLEDVAKARQAIPTLLNEGDYSI